MTDVCELPLVPLTVKSLATLTVLTTLIVILAFTQAAGYRKLGYEMYANSDTN